MNLRTWSLRLGILAVPLVFLWRAFDAWSGDAVIHLRIAELAARGHWFEFNLGERVMATTSLLWTVVLAGFYWLFGTYWATWAIKVFALGLWAATVLLLERIAARVTGSANAGLVALAVLAWNPGMFENSVNGMDAIGLALPLLYLFEQTLVDLRARPLRVLATAAVCALARPEGALFGGLLFLFLIARRDRALLPTLAALALGTGLGAGIVFAVNWAVSGELTGDSALARYAHGVRESVLLGPVHFHAKSLERAIAYLPLTLPAVLAFRQPASLGFQPARRFAGWVLLAMLFFYSFVVGANHTTRYWMPFLALLVLLGVAGLARVRRPLAVGALALLLGIYGYEIAARDRQGLGYPGALVASAVANRAEATAELRRRLGVDAETPLVLAMTEVQKRYFLADDGKIEIVSLDGRTGGHMSRYIDRRTGLRHLDRLLDDTKPDFIELEQIRPEEPFGRLTELARSLPPDTTLELDGFRFRTLPETQSYVRCLGRIQ